MKRFFTRLVVAALTFLIGVSATLVWLYLRREPIRPQTAGNVEEPSPMYKPEPQAILNRLRETYKGLRSYHFERTTIIEELKDYGLDSVTSHAS